MVIHQDLVFVAGDVWKIYGVLHNDDGSLMDITSLLANNDIKWMLVSGSTTYILAPDNAGIEITGIDPDEGTFVVTITPETTITVPRGRYTDFLRINTPEGPRTKWTGECHVRAGPPAIP